jgi:hypothetical protein
MQLSPSEVKTLLKAKGTNAAKLGRRWRRSRVTMHYLVRGELNSRPLRKKLADFLGVDESALPKKNQETN